MKSCAYCGKENEDLVTVCAECGTSEFKGAAVSPPAPASAQSTQGDLRLRDILTDPVGLFRALVVVSTFTFLIWFFQLILSGQLISQGTWDALSWHGYGALLPLPDKIAWLTMLLFAALGVGLYYFSKSARFVFTLLIGFYVVVGLLSGVQVQTAFGSFLSYLTNMADGAIIVMAYTSPLKERFE